MISCILTAVGGNMWQTCQVMNNMMYMSFSFQMVSLFLVPSFQLVVPNLFLVPFQYAVVIFVGLLFHLLRTFVKHICFTEYNCGIHV